MSGKPRPPGILAEYVVDALDRQSIDKLDAVEEYVRELRAYKRELQEQEFDEDEIVEDPDVVDVDDNGGDGYIVVKWQKCGADCECNDGKGHGPYKWRVTDGGSSWECLENVSKSG